MTYSKSGGGKDKTADVIEKILGVLMDGKPHETGELAENAGLTLDKTSRVLRRLEDMKFVRVEKDRNIKITREGKNFKNIGS